MQALRADVVRWRSSPAAYLALGLVFALGGTWLFVATTRDTHGLRDGVRTAAVVERPGR
jgi:hypothetical protein